MKSYEIWSEGFLATGQSGDATLHATVTANSFNEAVEKHAEQNPSFARYLSKTSTGYSYWGCRLFDNEADARKSFG